MKTHRLIHTLFAATAVLSGCAESPTNPAPGPESFVGDGLHINVARPVPDPLLTTDPLARVLGEGVIVCWEGPSAGRFDVSDGSSSSFVEVMPGSCQLVYQKEGESARVTVSARAQLDQRLASVVRTQVTCGNGVGRTCDPSTSPVIQTFTERNPVTGIVGGSGPASARSEFGLSGFVVHYVSEFVIRDPEVVGEGVRVCVRGAPSAEFDVDDGTTVTRVRVQRGCSIVYRKGFETAEVTVTGIVPSGYRLAFVTLKQLTCAKGLGIECVPGAPPVLVGPTTVGNPVKGFVGGTGPSNNRSQKGQAGFVAEFYHTR